MVVLGWRIELQLGGWGRESGEVESGFARRNDHKLPHLLLRSGGTPGGLPKPIRVLASLLLQCCLKAFVHGVSVSVNGLRAMALLVVEITMFWEGIVVFQESPASSRNS